MDGEVVEVKGGDIKVLCTSGKTIMTKLSNVYPKEAEAPPCGVDDMTKLAYLHELGVLDNLKARYDINEIYTYVGNILIVVNPFQRLPHLYDSHMMAQYKGAAFGELSPHPFAVADAAYRQMINEGISQSILVSGESGAGKTESTKLLMRYLAYMGGRSASEGRSVEQQVLESNPVLEAFGNAKIVRNNNSSRFGKFVELQFDQRGRISGLLSELTCLKDLVFAKFLILKGITIASICFVLPPQRKKLVSQRNPLTLRIYLDEFAKGEFSKCFISKPCSTLHIYEFLSPILFSLSRKLLICTTLLKIICLKVVLGF